MPQGTGSRISRQYTDDTGTQRVCIVDKSNAESPDLAFAVAPGGNVVGRAVASGQPRPGVVMRQVSCWRLNSNGEMVRRKFPVATGAQMAVLMQQANPTVTVSGFLYFVSAFIGEKRYVAAVVDTGITDVEPAP